MPRRAPHLPAGIRFAGHAIVSADGMIADAQGAMPDALRSDADWRAFQAALDQAALVVLGRRGHERHRNPGRRRLVLTRSVAALLPDMRDPLALLWNPAANPLRQVLQTLAITQGVIAVTGVFDLFLGLYHRFDLTEAHAVVLPGGTPCFRAGHPRAVLAADGLVPGEAMRIDRGVTITAWLRA